MTHSLSITHSPVDAGNTDHHALATCLVAARDIGGLERPQCRLGDVEGFGSDGVLA